MPRRGSTAAEPGQLIGLASHCGSMGLNRLDGGGQQHTAWSFGPGPLAAYLYRLYH